MPVANKINSTMSTALTWSMVPGFVKQIAGPFPEFDAHGTYSAGAPVVDVA
jgi:hypothetical protein